MDKSKPIAKRLLTQLLILVFLLYLFLLVVTMLMTVLIHRFDVTSAIVFENVLTTAAHPLKYVSAAVADRNPLVILGGAAIIVYTMYFFFKNLSKNKSWTVDANDTHGSAKWINNKALGNSVNVKQQNLERFHSDWTQTLVVDLEDEAADL